MSYFKIPSNLNINIDEKTYKLILKEKDSEETNQVCSYNLSNYLKNTQLLEIYNMFHIADYKHPIKTFHLAEGPWRIHRSNYVFEKK